MCPKARSLWLFLVSQRVEKEAAQRNAPVGCVASSETSVPTSQNLYDSIMSLSKTNISLPAEGRGTPRVSATATPPAGPMQQLEHMGFVEQCTAA